MTPMENESNMCGLAPDSPSNIIALNPQIASELEITKKETDLFRRCPGQHKSVIADEETRTLTCRQCGFVVDSFEYVLAWARTGAGRMSALKDIEHRRKIAQAEHDDLTRKIKNMREQLKRGGMPQPPQERDAFNIRRWNPHQEGTPHQAKTP